MTPVRLPGMLASSRLPMANEPVLSRRTFLGFGALALAGEAPNALPRATSGRVRAVPAGFPRQDLELVQEVVRAAHFDADVVQEMVRARPALATAAWDWGFGDWETPLGAASHTGRREIAEFLMAHGAHPGLLTLAMLGELDAVRGILEARPAARGIPGPHGLTLLHHARAGGEAAAPVVHYLERLGGADRRPTDLPISEEEIRAYVGSYVLVSDPSVRFRIVGWRGQLAFRRRESAPRRLLRQDEHEFHPVGAPDVRIRFELRGERAVGVDFVDGPSTITASRSR